MAEPRRTTGNTGAGRSQRERAAYVAPRTTVRTDRSGKNDTDAGLTAAQRRAVNAEENRVKGRQTESASIINQNGEVTRRLTSRSSNHVSFAGVPDSELKDAVIIHNHPGRSQRSAFGNTLATRVGSPLSSQDLVFAARNDVAEIRAVTYSGDGGGYVYSIRRPEGGWAITDASDLRDLNGRTRASGLSYVTGNRQYYTQGREQASRAELMAQWTSIQEMAQALGSRITRRRFNQ